jgi:integrase
LWVANAHEAAGKAPLTVKDAVEQYVIWIERNKRSGKYARGHAERNIIPGLGHHLVEDLSHDIIETWKQERAAAPPWRRPARKGERTRAGPSTDEEKRKRRVTANRSLSVLKAALNRAYAGGKVTSDRAWRHVEPFVGVEEARVEWLEFEEARRLVRRAADDFAKLAEGGLVTGARYGELRRMNVGDFAADPGTVLVRRSKTYRARHIELTDEGVEFFIRLCRGRSADKPMFVRADGNCWGDTEQVRPMRKACAAAEIASSKAFFHILRHTWSSQAVMNGVPIMVVAKNLGHTTTRMVEKHYGHLAPGYVRQEIRKGGPRFRAIASNVRSLDEEREKKRKRRARTLALVVARNDSV